MSKYAIRTCKICGIKKPANELYLRTINSDLLKGKSSRDINMWTFLGDQLGDKKSSKAISEWLFQSSNRKYSASRTKQINICENCVPSFDNSNHLSGKGSSNFFKWAIIIIIILLILGS